MSGQREQNLPLGPGYTAQRSVSPAASVSTAQGTYRPSHEVADTSGIAAIGSALGSFFGSAAKTAQDLDAIEHQENLQGIRRENDVLAHAAAADQAAGRPRDPDMAKRWSYEATYTRALAGEQAQTLAAQWGDVVRDAPRDGTFNYDEKRSEFFKEHVGAGLGDPFFDAAHMTAFKQQTDAGRAQFQGEVFKTVQVNNQRTYQSFIAGKLDSQFGLTSQDVTEGLTQARVMAQGNEDQATRLFTSAITSNINTEFQATSVLMSLDRAGFRETHPDLYRHISDKASEQIDQVRNLETRQSLDRLTARVTNALVAPTIDINAIDALQTDITRSARAFGAQKDHRHLLTQLYTLRKQAATDEAEINLFDRAVTEGLTGPEAARTGGLEIGAYINKHQDKAFGRYMDDASKYPELAATKTGYNTFRPLASKGTALEFATHVTSPKIMRATVGLIPDTYKVENDVAILGTDAAAAGNAYALAASIERITGNRETALQAFKSDDAKRAYQSIRSSEGIQRAEELITARLRNPAEFERMQKAQDGSLDFTTLPGQQGRKSFEVRKDIADALRDALREQHGIDSWFGPGVRVSGDSLGFADERTTNDLIAGTVRQVSELARLNPGTTPDIKAAAKAEVALHADRTVVLPAGSGGFNVYPQIVDPKKGSAYLQPFEGAPGRNVYRIGLVTNALGEVEDTRKHFAEDAKELVRLFPSQSYDVKKLAFRSPDPALAAKGLYSVSHGPDGLMFELGQTVTLAGPKGTKTVNEFHIPEDPAEARRMLTQALGHTGWRPEEPNETYGLAGRKVIRLVYGGRIEKDAAWVKNNEDAFTARAGGAVTEAQMAQDALKAGAERLARGVRRPSP